MSQEANGEDLEALSASESPTALINGAIGHHSKISGTDCTDFSHLNQTEFILTV